MKKRVLYLAVALMVIAASTSSCRSCKGGGWYGDRNLGYAPVKEQPSDAQMKLEDDEENCNTAEP